jgi:hypothetical protein
MSGVEGMDSQSRPTRKHSLLINEEGKITLNGADIGNLRAMLDTAGR